MNAPVISVVLPAYNCEKFIGKAIQSVLHQTFSDFELIIINDGSTDNTEFAILEFADPRIVYIKNQTNKGLIFSLNRGIEMAQGTYIARMDADDICLPERLDKQKNFLDQNKNISLVACTINFINEDDENKGVWKLDRQTITEDQIRSKMPSENCLAHPTVMVRADIARELKYNERQKNIEDYDLWLRLLNRGHSFAKINEPLLRYRLHEKSVTSIYLKKTNPFFRHVKMKTRFLQGEILAGYISWFTFRVAGNILIDILKGTGKAVKNS